MTHFDGSAAPSRASRLPPRATHPGTMLVLTRKAGEAIRIGDGVVVRVLGVRGGQVSVGVEAPAEIRVLRDEVAGGPRSGNGASHDGPAAADCTRRRPPASAGNAENGSGSRRRFPRV